jgi:hypothetical protein
MFNLHSSIIETYEMLRCAFKDKIPAEFYDGILLTLLQRLSVDQTVDVVAGFTDKAYMEVYSDVKNIQTPIDEELILHPIKILLLSCGYSEWLSTSPYQNNFVPSYLMRTYEMLKCAFPDGLANEEQEVLIPLLHPHMSNRSLGRVLSALKKEEYFMAFFDAYGFNPAIPIDSNILERVKQRLVDCGYEDWLSQDV